MLAKTPWGISKQWYFNRLKLKHCYWFYLAHKPLCHPFQHDLIKIGHCYICRSCSWVYIAMTTIIVAYYLSDLYNIYITPDLIWTYTLTISLYTLILSFPKLYHYCSRAFRDVIRFSLGLTIGLNLLLWLTIPSVKVLMLTSVLLISRYYYPRLRQSQSPDVCQHCPEYNQTQICSGFRQQAQAIRCYEQQATEYLLATAYQPLIKTKNQSRFNQTNK